MELIDSWSSSFGPEFQALLSFHAGMGAVGVSNPRVNIPGRDLKPLGGSNSFWYGTHLTWTPRVVSRGSIDERGAHMSKQRLILNEVCVEQRGGFALIF